MSTFDRDGVLGHWLPITDVDRETYRQAQAERLVISPWERDAILQVARANPERSGEDPQDHDMRILNELSIELYPQPVPSLLAVSVVMAAWRAGHLA